MNSNKRKNHRANPTRAQRPKGPERSVVAEGVYNNAQFMHVVTSNVGNIVQVHTQNGSIFEGIFRTFSHQFEIVIEMAHKVDPNNPTKLNADTVVQKLIFRPKDVICIVAKDVEIDYAMKDTFATDTAISKFNGMIVERELEPWEGGAGHGDDVELGEESGNGWDPQEMFKKNEQKYGVRSTFDHSLVGYTTPLQKLNKEDEAEAIKIAQEIEKNPEHRTRAELENGDDEEHAAAVTRPDGSPCIIEGKYIPPNKRKNSQTGKLTKTTPPPQSSHHGNSSAKSYSSGPVSASNQSAGSHNSYHGSASGSSHSSTPSAVSSPVTPTTPQGPPPVPFAPARTPPGQQQPQPPTVSVLNFQHHPPQHHNQHPLQQHQPNCPPHIGGPPPSQQQQQQHHHPPLPQGPPASSSKSGPPETKVNGVEVKSHKMRDGPPSRPGVWRGGPGGEPARGGVGENRYHEQKHGPPPGPPAAFPSGPPAASLPSVPEGRPPEMPHHQVDAIAMPPPQPQRVIERKGPNARIHEDQLTDLRKFGQDFKLSEGDAGPDKKMSQQQQQQQPPLPPCPGGSPVPDEPKESEVDKISNTLKKSTLNPNAKEFVYNPTPKPFTPRSPSTPTPSRPHTPPTPQYSMRQQPVPMMIPTTYVVAHSQHALTPPNHQNNRFRKAVPLSHRPDLASQIQVAAATGPPLLAPAPMPTQFPLPYAHQTAMMANNQQPFQQIMRMVAPQPGMVQMNYHHESPQPQHSGPLYMSPAHMTQQHPPPQQPNPAPSPAQNQPPPQPPTGLPPQPPTPQPTVLYQQQVHQPPMQHTHHGSQSPAASYPQPPPSTHGTPPYPMMYSLIHPGQMPPPGHHHLMPQSVNVGSSGLASVTQVQYIPHQHHPHQVGNQPPHLPAVMPHSQ